MSDSYKSLYEDETKYRETQDDLQRRIKEVNDKIMNLEDLKMNLMMLKRDINWKYTYNRLDNCFTEEMKQMLEDHYSEEKS